MSANVLQKRLAISCLSFFVSSLTFSPVALAADRYWRGQMNNSNQFENPINWSATLGGNGGVAAPTASDEVFFISNSTGSTLLGKTVLIKSNASANGIVINQNMTGTILLGTGALTVGWNGVRMGSGRIIGGTASNTVAVRGGFTQTGGIVRVGNGTFAVSGSFVVTGSTTNFTSTGTVILNGGAQNLNAAYRASFTNLTVASTGATTLLSDVSTVSGTLQISTGATVSLGSYTLYATGATIINYGTITEGTGYISHTSSNVLITDANYAEDNSLTPGYVYFNVTDSDENIDGTVQDTMAITVTASTGDSESVTLTETTNTSGIFRGSILATSSTGYVASNGALEITSTATVSFTYTDAQDSADTGSDTATLTIAAASSASSSTATGGGGGRRGGGNTTPASSSAQSAASSSQHAVGTLPEVRGYLSVSIDGQQVVFRDVPVVEWFAQYILSLVDAGVISGYRDAQGELTGEFKPGNSVTYAEIAKMAVEAAGLMPRVGSQPNNRSARGQWSSGYIAALEEKGVSVFASSGLDVNTPAPRGAVLQIILETFGQTIVSPQGGVYSDVSADTMFAGAVETATAEGIVSGDDGRSTFRPAAYVNRAETAKIVRNAMMMF
ncbi:MAG: S-layer homology domain-containing protein [Candidatus Peregrinibacteria bacterium]